MGQVITVLVVGMLLTLIILETLSGCGQRTYFQNRTWVTGECLFIPYTTTSGKW
jgi:hypothetical protein